MPGIAASRPEEPLRLAREHPDVQAPRSRREALLEDPAGRRTWEFPRYPCP